MIHLPALRYYGRESLQSIIDQTLGELQTYTDAEFDGVMIENFHDTPFATTRVSDEVIAKLSAILHQVSQISEIKIGLNILRNASSQAMELACLYDLDFIRSNIWEGSYVTDQGIIHSAAKEVLEVRRKWNKPVEVMADVLVKHAYPLGNFSLTESAENALHRGHADHIILSGAGTGKPTPISHVDELNTIGIKPLIGSGMNLDNLEDYAGKISGAIVGTALKIDGKVSNPLDLGRTKEFADRYHSIF